jgi:Zn-dependent protease with chaperone function
VRIFCKLGIISLLFFVLLASCAGPNTQICHPSNSPSCLNATEVWSNSINKVVAANFQDELGFYKPVVHKAKFSNAWVATGGEINITLSLLKRLNEVRRICVISHELAHLKSNHYYSKLGISTLTSAAMSLAGAFVPGLGYLDHVVNPAVTNTFGRQFELNADRLAVEYIKKTGLTKMDYLKFLYWMKENLDSSSKPEISSLFSTHPATQERINELLKG